MVRRFRDPGSHHESRSQPRAAPRKPRSELLLRKLWSMKFRMKIKKRISHGGRASAQKQSGKAPNIEDKKVNKKRFVIRVRRKKGNQQNCERVGKKARNGLVKVLSTLLLSVFLRRSSDKTSMCMSSIRRTLSPRTCLPALVVGGKATANHQVPKKHLVPIENKCYMAERHDNFRFLTYPQNLDWPRVYFPYDITNKVTMSHVVMETLFRGRGTQEQSLIPESSSTHCGRNKPNLNGNANSGK
uniref:uncharacterized protein n=1 Tax=Myxine glutinosa TaxID=7769 RepID=UPI00358F9109